MKMTQHAQKRIQQRGFSPRVIDTILDAGVNQNAPGGASIIFLGRKEYQAVVSELKRAIQLMDKAKGSTIVVKNGKIITLYK